jgi:enediyne biosynthesis protein E4
MKYRSLIGWWLLIATIGVSPALGGERQWHKEREFKWAALDVPGPGKTGFTLLLPTQTGITFTNTLDERTGEANRVLFNGSGVAAGDFDHDGLADIYFCSLNGRNALYKNLGGWNFKDVTRESGIVCSN